MAQRNPNVPFSSQHDHTRTVLVAGMDTVRHKNIYQFEGLSVYGYKFIILTTDSLGHSREWVKDLDNVELYVTPLRNPLGLLKLLVLLIKILQSRQIDLAEIYPFGISQFMTAILLKLYRIPTVIIARGQELSYIKRLMAWRSRLFFGLTYRVAKYVIYKEPYMVDFLRRYRLAGSFFLHNAVPLESFYKRRSEPGRCNLLYLNMIRSFRYPEIIVSAFKDICGELGLKASSGIRLAVVGFMNNPKDPKYSKEMALRKIVNGLDIPVDFIPWTEQPKDWLDKADVFLLPADVVYLNYALLEAMSRGIPVIISDATWADRIVTNGLEGYILPLDPSQWKVAMLRLILDPELRLRMGEAARKKVEQEYSIAAYCQEYLRIYSEILSNKHNDVDGSGK